MPYKIDEIEGVGPAFAEKLASADIKTSDDLLEHCAHSAGRKKVSEKTGVSEAMLLKWSNHADLMRVSGIGPQFAELLEASGVDTIRELGTRNADNLATKMKEINEQRKLARTTPPVPTVEGWVTTAKSMQPKISH